ncbi:MAG: NADH-quinone oxidoreductase subunit C [Nitrospiraceae bacterium]|nr:NADH-quinone oxidoreductase subunit C [Nitrospiraceae bacterium]
MEPLQIAEKIKETFPDEVAAVSQFRDQVSVHLKKDRIFEICQYLHDTPELDFDYLVDVCGVDYLGKKTPRFEVVYHMYSIAQRHFIRLRAQVPEEEPVIRSVVPVWRGADWHERECFDMMGIRFEGHPDLRRILLPEDWVGHPLRKDYPVEGYSGEEDWAGYREVVEKSKKLKEFEWGR